jgi:large subunit ribosomal protein L6
LFITFYTMPEKIVAVPEGVDVTVTKNRVVVKGPKGELSKLYNRHITITKKDTAVVITQDSERRTIKALAGTWKSHLTNMIIGVTKGYQVKMKIVYSHFPIKFSVKDGVITIENFLGERSARTTRIVEDTEIKNDKDTVTITGIDKEKVGQAAANIELTAKVTGFDRRVFQDGIYVVEKTHPMEEV